MNAIIHRPKFQYREDIASDSRWREFLDEVRVYSEKMEHEIRSLRENGELLLTIINLIPVGRVFCERSQESLFSNKSRL